MNAPDLAILVTGAARVVADRLGAAVERAGIEDMRSSYGFLIRALAAGDRTLTELAQLLGVSKQAAIKVVDEMERRGYLERCTDPADRRVSCCGLPRRPPRCAGRPCGPAANSSANFVASSATTTWPRCAARSYGCWSGTARSRTPPPAARAPCGELALTPHNPPVHHGNVTAGPERGVASGRRYASTASTSASTAGRP